MLCILTGGISSVEGKLCFVILHYGENKIITFNAIESIMNLEKSEMVDIVVVCNGKKFDISSDIKARYSSNVNVIVLDENKGFSIGNNAGYRYAKMKAHYDFIIFINNDVIVEQKDFICCLYDIYERHNFYICGPDIYTPYIDFHSSPLKNEILSKKEIDLAIDKKKKSIKAYSRRFSFSVIKSYMIESFKERDMLTVVFKFWRKIKKNNCSYKSEQENVVLQGSCLIYSRDYIVCNEKAFEPEVFLYFEEYYLAMRCKTNGWNMFYTNKIAVKHFHRGSSGLLGETYREYCNKKRKIAEIYINAAENIKKYMANMEE